MYQPPGQQPPPYGPGTPPPFQGGPGTPPPFGAYPPPPPPHRRSNKPVMIFLAIATIGVIAVALLVFLVVLADDDDNNVVARPSASVPAQQQQEQPQQNGNANANGTFESSYVGTWRGTVYQRKPSSSKYTVTVTITGGGTGQITYQNDPSEATSWSCSGTLTWLRHTPNADYKTVVQENITVKNNAKCDTYSYDVLFPKSDGTGMFITNYFTEAAADVDKDYSAIGTLLKQ